MIDRTPYEQRKTAATPTNGHDQSSKRRRARPTRPRPSRNDTDPKRHGLRRNRLIRREFGLGGL